MCGSRQSCDGVGGHRPGMGELLTGGLRRVRSRDSPTPAPRLNPPVTRFPRDCSQQVARDACNPRRLPWFLPLRKTLSSHSVAQSWVAATVMTRRMKRTGNSRPQRVSWRWAGSSRGPRREPESQRAEQQVIVSSWKRPLLSLPSLASCEGHASKCWEALTSCRTVLWSQS